MNDGAHLFPYIQIGSYHRPIIPIFLSYQGITIEYHALVDSGADFNVFHADIADIFGINLDHSRQEAIAGIGGGATAYPFMFELGIDENSLFRAPALLSPDIALGGYGIIGQVGFFDRFIVEFTYDMKQVALTPSA